MIIVDSWFLGGGLVADLFYVAAFCVLFVYFLFAFVDVFLATFVSLSVF